MEINKFKKGDIITRVQASKGNGDRSYMGDRLEFVGTEKGLIVLIAEDRILYQGGHGILKLRTDWWSEGWDYFPKSLFEKAKQRLLEIKNKK